jgi:hypothetical protein
VIAPPSKKLISNLIFKSKEMKIELLTFFINAVNRFSIFLRDLYLSEMVRKNTWLENQKGEYLEFLNFPDYEDFSMSKDWKSDIEEYAKVDDPYGY